MASVSKDQTGNVRILFTGADRKRRTIYLGKTSKKNAEAIRTKVEALVAANASRLPLDTETAAWVGSVGDDLAAKLASVGLIPERSTCQFAGIKEYFLGYVASRPDIAKNTRRNYLQAIRYLANFLGANRLPKNVSAGDAERFAAHMRGNFALATANRTITHGKQLFRVAERDGLIEKNPFRDVKGGTMANPDRMHFVTAEQTVQLLEACPDGEWRLIVALARYGGLRTPSEHLALTWADVDWERERFLVRSPKTGLRWVPIFPELRPHLEEAFDRAEPGAVHIITRTRDASANWRTTFSKIILRAGLLPWEKPFQNLRASRETELAKDFPLHVATSWIGNSVAVAAKHYLQVTDADFAKAVKGDADSDARATQKTTQTAADRKRPEWSELGESLENKPLCTVESISVHYCPDDQYPRQESNL